ncbi:MAG: DUF1800 family protein, partial [Bacteroidota bacterium]
YWKALPISADEQDGYRSELDCFKNVTGQEPLSAPSVFNFYRPDYQPQGAIGQNYLEAPEFQILNSTNSIGIVNHADLTIIRRDYFLGCLEEQPDADDTEIWEYGHYMDYTFLEGIANNTNELIRRIDILYANGNMSTATKDIIKTAVNQLGNPVDKVRMALYLTMISPDYAIQK